MWTFPVIFFEKDFFLLDDDINDDGDGDRDRDDETV